MTKREAREILFTLVYESEFDLKKSAADIYRCARESREFDDFRYIRKGLSDIISEREFFSSVIEKRADGWKISRIAPVTRAIMYVAVYDLICRGLAVQIAINEAVLLAKKYDSPDAVPFINGVLNKIAVDMDEIVSERNNNMKEIGHCENTGVNPEAEVPETKSDAESV